MSEIEAFGGKSAPKTLEANDSLFYEARRKDKR